VKLAFKQRKNDIAKKELKEKSDIAKDITNDIAKKERDLMTLSDILFSLSISSPSSHTEVLLDLERSLTN